MINNYVPHVEVWACAATAYRNRRREADIGRVVGWVERKDVFVPLVVFSRREHEAVALQPGYDPAGEWTTVVSLHATREEAEQQTYTARFLAEDDRSGYEYAHNYVPVHLREAPMPDEGSS